jgi:serine/threonine-protein kinase ULK/ATG1
MSRPEDEEVKPYIIVGDLGKGSFATVYKGYHEVSVCTEALFSG